MKSVIILATFLVLLAFTQAHELEVSHTKVQSYGVLDWFTNVGLWFFYLVTLPIFQAIGWGMTLFANQANWFETNYESMIIKSSTFAMTYAK